MCSITRRALSPPSGSRAACENFDFRLCIHQGSERPERGSRGRSCSTGGPQMSKNQYRLMLGLAMVTGLVGSGISSFLFTGSAVFALRTPTPAEVLRAQRFELLDKEGQPRARLSLGEGGRARPRPGEHQEPGGAAYSRSCTCILRISFQPENQVVYHRFPRGEGKRHGRQPPFP